MASDLELLKEIPGYKAILKSVLKSQIQLLIEQLADHTGEESIILTASVNDGALSHLGSSTGKGFLEGRDEIKSQFLGYCLKTHHKQRNDHNSSPYHHAEKGLMSSHMSSKRPRIRQMPYPMSPSGHHTNISSPTSVARTSSSDINKSSYSRNTALNLGVDSMNQSENFLEVVPGATGSSRNQSDDQGDAGTIGDLSQQGAGNQENGSMPIVKSEPGTEDDDLEVTGVELGENSLSSENWSQGYGSKDENNVDGDQSGYNSSEQAQNDPPATSEPLGGIAFPGLDNMRHNFPSASANHLPDISPTELKHALYPEGTEMYQNNSIYFASNSEEYDIMKSHYEDAVTVTPRKRGRPRKHIISPHEAMNQMNHNDISPDDPDSLSPKGRGRGRRGRPRKELDALPAGFVRPAGISLGNGYVKCNICGKILKATSMFTHKQAHLGIKKFRCEFCTKSFTQKGPLITHRRTHTGEKPYSCLTCGKPFAAQSGLYQHSRRCPRGFNHNVTI